MQEPTRQGRERVSLVRCAPDSADAEIVRRTEEAIALLGEDWSRVLRGARTIAVKINAGVRRIVLTEGRQTELTDPAVVEGAVRALRAVTSAEILIGDAPTDGDAAGLYAALGYPERLARYANVRLVDFNTSELVDVEMPHEDALFRRYTLPRELAEADAFVSLAKMKAHVSMGCTLCIKNLFGWMPTSVYGAPRAYLHDRLIRLPRVLCDMALWTRPCLNVVDGIVAANKSEWHGEPLRPGVILAGTNIVATDSTGARVMGFDPCGDYPDHPFLYRRNAIGLAAGAGLGPNRAAQIEIVGDASIDEVVTPFTVHRHGSDDDAVSRQRRDAEIRRGADCVARYRERQDDLARRYPNRILALFDGQILWDGPDMATMQRLEGESGRDWQNAPQFLIRCLPPNGEIERLDWYEAEAARQ